MENYAFEDDNRLPKKEKARTDAGPQIKVGTPVTALIVFLLVSDLSALNADYYVSGRLLSVSKCMVSTDESSLCWAHLVRLTSGYSCRYVATFFKWHAKNA